MASQLLFRIPDFFFLHLHGSPQAAELIAPLSPKVSLLLWHFTWASLERIVSFLREEMLPKVLVLLTRIGIPRESPRAAGLFFWFYSQKHVKPLLASPQLGLKRRFPSA